MEIPLTPAQQQQLEALAEQQGEAPAETARRIVAEGLERHLAQGFAGPGVADLSMRRLTDENGIGVLRTGRPLPAKLTDEVLERIREARSGR